MTYQNITAEQHARISGLDRELYVPCLGSLLYAVNQEQMQAEHPGEFFGIVYSADNSLSQEPRFHFSNDNQQLVTLIKSLKQDGEVVLMGSVDDFVIDNHRKS